jgi:hypothetical protein
LGSYTRSESCLLTIFFSCIDASLQPLDGSYKDVEAACVLVRSCGAALDKAEADQLAAVLSRFKRLELTETSQSRLRFMVLDVVEESGKRWNSRLAKATPQKVKADVLVPLVPNSRTPIKFRKIAEAWVYALSLLRAPRWSQSLPHCASLAAASQTLEGVAFFSSERQGT